MACCRHLSTCALLLSISAQALPGTSLDFSAEPHNVPTVRRLRVMTRRH